MPISRHVRRVPLVALAAVILALVLPVLYAPPVRAVETRDLPAEPPARRTVVLEEVWRLGGDDEDVLLGLVTGGVLADEGNVLLTDEQLAHVLVVGPDGKVTRTLGREGDGPGELRRLQSVFAAGERAGLVQEFPGRVVYLDREGLPAGGFALGGPATDGGEFAIRELCRVGSALVAHINRSAFDEAADRCVTRATLAVLDLDGAITAELAEHEVTRGARHIVMDEAASWTGFDVFAAGPGGRVAIIADRDAWLVHELDLAGHLQRVLRRPCPQRKRTDEEKDAAVSRIRLAVVIGGTDIDKRPLPTDPVIVGLAYAADGRLFVTTCYNAPELLEPGVVGRYDVIAPDGRYREELTVAFPGFDPQKDRLVFLDGTRYLVLRNYEGAKNALYAAYRRGEQSEDLSEVEPLEVVLAKIPD